MTDDQNHDDLTPGPAAPYAYPGSVPQPAAGGNPGPVTARTGVGLTDESAPAVTAARGRRTGLIVGGVVAALALGGGGVLAAQRLSGGGAQPSDVLPSDAFAYVRLDIDPSAGQKIAAVRFLGKLPQVKDTLESADPRKKLWELASKDASSACLSTFSYDTDIAPWLGDRVGAAVRPGGTSKDPNVAVALQVTDEAAARDALTRLFACDTSGTGTDLRMKDGYAIITPKGTGDATLAAVEKGSLSQNTTFTADMTALGEQGVLSAWFDLGGGLKEIQQLGGTTGLDMATLGTTKGRIATALRFDASYIEMAGIVRGADGAASVKGDSSEVASLPANTLAAVNVSGADTMIDSAWPQLKKQLGGLALGGGGTDPIAEIEQQLGITLPGDLKVLLGRSFTLAAPGQDLSGAVPSVGVKIVSSDARRADELVGRLMETAGLGSDVLTHSVVGDKVFVATTPDYADDLKAGGKLGESEAFKLAVGDASTANMTLFVDLDKVATLTKGHVDGDVQTVLESLKSAGFTTTATGKGEGSFSLRVVGD